MNLKSLVCLAAIAYTLVIGGSLLLYRLFIVLPSLQTAELDLRKYNISAIASVYASDRANFILFNLDWSKWDDTYDFIRSGNHKYIQDNIFSPSFLETETNAVLFFDMAGTLLYAAQKTNKHFNEVKQLGDITNDLNISQLLNQDEQFGFVRHKENLGYYVSHHIQDSATVKEANGVLVFIRDFNSRFFNRSNLNKDLIFKITNLSKGEPSIYPATKSFNINNLQDTYTFGLGNNLGEVIALATFNFPKSSTPQAIDTTTLFSIASLLTLPLFITVVIYFLMLKPIIEISTNINRMKKTGEVFRLVQRSYVTEIDDFLIRFNILVDKIHSYQKKLLDDSNTDGLTEIHNRKFFDQAYDTCWRTNSRHPNCMAVIMLDIDFFKKYNDHYGHQQGDIALKQVAQALNKLTRRAEDILARYGGEEFVIIYHTQSKLHLQKTLKSILNSINQLNIEHVKSNTASHLTLSCGACYIESTGPWMKEFKEDALKISDQALYEAKGNGRNQYCIRALNPPKNS